MTTYYEEYDWVPSRGPPLLPPRLLKIERTPVKDASQKLSYVEKGNVFKNAISMKSKNVFKCNFYNLTDDAFRLLGITLSS